jgi:hypothetical protein
MTVGRLPPPQTPVSRPDLPLHLQRLKDRIEHDEYVVDPLAVADALLRRRGARRLLAVDVPGTGVSRDGARSPRRGPGDPRP